MDDVGHTINIIFLHPCIPAKSFVYPKCDDILDVDPSDILTRVNPTLLTGRTYTLCKNEASCYNIAINTVKWSTQILDNWGGGGGENLNGCYFQQGIPHQGILIPENHQH